MGDSRCSFCGKARDEVARLIAGPDVFICDACVRLCASVLEPISKTDFKPRESDLLVRFPDRTIRGCFGHSNWKPFISKRRTLEWCTATGYDGKDLPFLVVCVRRRRKRSKGALREMPTGQPFPLGAQPTEADARRIVERYGLT